MWNSTSNRICDTSDSAAGHLRSDANMAQKRFRCYGVIMGQYCPSPSFYLPSGGQNRVSTSLSLEGRDKVEGKSISKSNDLRIWEFLSPEDNCGHGSHSKWAIASTTSKFWADLTSAWVLIWFLGWNVFKTRIGEGKGIFILRAARKLTEKPDLT